MSFQPLIPMSGYIGWKFLERTLERQEAAHEKSAPIQRIEAYFRKSFPEVRSVDDIVSDSRLLKVVLTAFGLSADLPNKAFIKKVLESDTSDPRSFASRLVDKRYLELSSALGLGASIDPDQRMPQITEAILTRFREFDFEEAVGNIDINMRHALSLQRDLRILAERDISEDARWYNIIATPAFREVFQTSFSLPKEFSGQDVDLQVKTLKERLRSLTGDGSIEQFKSPSAISSLIRLFFVSEQISSVSISGPGSAALEILRYNLHDSRGGRVMTH